MIKTACAGFPVGKKRYEARLFTVELSPSAKRPPRPATAAKWRREAPRAFEFVVAVPGSAAAPAAGAGLSIALALARDLESKILLFRVPAGAPPNSDVVHRLQRLIPAASHRNGVQFVWEPPPAWPASLVTDLSRHLSLVPAIDPLKSRLRAVPAAFRYFRIESPPSAPALSDRELRSIRAACDRPLSYVVFDRGPGSFEDAVRFAATI